MRVVLQFRQFSDYAPMIFLFVGNSVCS